MKYKLFFLIFAAATIFFFSANQSYSAPKTKTASTDTAAQDTAVVRYKNPEGTEFWLCFEKNFKEDENKTRKDTLYLELFISGVKDASVTVEIDGLKFVKNIFIPKGTVANVRIPEQAQVQSEEIVERLAVHITSDNPISVYGLNSRKQTTDTYLGLPTSVLGKEYRAMCYTVSDLLMPQFAVVATEDSTIVTFVTTVNTTKHPAGYPYSVLLNRGDVYQVTANYERNRTCDLTGSYIKADKPIAVFSGHQCAYVTPRISACNHLVEQMPPLTSWGKHFYVGQLQFRSAYTYRVLANEPDTKVFVDNELITTLQQGQFYEASTNKNIQITAGKPILVAQYSQGYNNGDSIGDPMMIIVSPTLQFLKKYQFATPMNGNWRHLVNVVVPTKAIRTLRLDDEKVDSAKFEQLGISRYSIGFLEVPFGSHRLEAKEPFGMYSYGFGFSKNAFDAYGTMGGQSFADYEPTRDSLPPTVEEESSSKTQTLIVRDDRLNDAGIKTIEFVKNEGLNVSIPKFEEGTAQVRVSISPSGSASFARGIIHVTDASIDQNSAVYTICYIYDPERGRNVFFLTEGDDANCHPKPTTEVGLFARNTFNINKASFTNDANGYDFIGKMDSKTHNYTYFGAYIGRRFFGQWNFSSTISLEKYKGAVTAKGPVDSVRDEYTNGLLPYQQSQSVELTGYNLHIDLRSEYFFNKMLYGLGGLDFGINLAKDVEIRDHILRPADFTFSDGTNNRISPNAPTKLSKMSAFRMSLLLGAGVTYPIKYGFAVFGEAQYFLPLNSIIDNWTLHRIGLLVGLKYKI